MENESVDEYREINNEVYKPLTYQTNGAVIVPANEIGKKDSLFLYFAAITVNLFVFASGTNISWTSPVLPQLKSTDLNINPLGRPITAIEESLIASLPALGAVGPLFAGKLVHIFGRKNTLLFAVLLSLVSTITLAFATHVNVYYVTRLLIGIGGGIPLPIVPIYIAEICQDHNRGKFGCYVAIFQVLGIVYSLAVGPFLSIKMFTLSTIIPMIIFISCFFLCIPESPMYLVSIGDPNKAVHALKKFRNSPSTIEKDMLEITETIQESSRTTAGRYRDIFKSRVLRKGLTISIGLSILQQFAGQTVIFAFIGPIFDLAGSGISTYVSTVTVGVIQVVSTAFSSSVVEKFGRKSLLLASTLCTSFSLFVLGIYFYLKTADHPYIESIFWLPITFVIIYDISINSGLVSVPWAIMGEIFPSNVKSVATSVVTFFGALSAFCVMLVFPIAVESLGMAVCFLVLGGCSLVGSVFIYFVIPETKGKSLLEIQRMLNE